jgi:O-antigen/teichoic acid export membrane protein
VTGAPAGERTLASRVARGTIVNGTFLVAINLLGAVRGVVLAGLMGVTEFGVWGLVAAVYGTLAWLAAVGIDDKYIQQDEPDQQAAFQTAFTLQCLVCAGFTVLALAAVPLFAVLYDQDDIVAPGLVCAAAFPAIALQSPLWVFVRRLEFLRQRRLQIWDPVVGFLVAVPLAAAGLGVWAAVAGTLAGAWAAAAVAVRASPYPLVFRRSALEHAREYASFSWPLFVASAAAVAAGQIPLLVASRKLGLEAVGAITLATTIALFAYRVDEVLTQTLYPAVAKVKDDAGSMWTAFSMSNRLALLWAVPLAAAAALFARDLVDYVLGDEWSHAVTLIGLLAGAAAVNQLGFNWTAFFRARAQTRPIAAVDLVMLAGVLAVAVPLLVDEGLDGFGVGWLAATLFAVAARFAYLARLFPLRRVAADLSRALVPTIPAAAVVLALRLAAPGHSPARAAAEAALFCAVAATATLVWERRLLGDAVALLRRPPASERVSQTPAA